MPGLSSGGFVPQSCPSPLTAYTRGVYAGQQRPLRPALRTAGFSPFRPEQGANAPPGIARPPPGRAILRASAPEWRLDVDFTIKHCRTSRWTPARGRTMPSVVLRCHVRCAQAADGRLFSFLPGCCTSASSDIGCARRRAEPCRPEKGRALWRALRFRPIVSGQRCQITRPGRPRPRRGPRNAGGSGARPARPSVPARSARQPSAPSRPDRIARSHRHPPGPC